MAQPTSGAADNRSLHELAVDTIQDIHLLATGLAHAGVPQQMTNQLEAVAPLFAGIAKVLAGGPVGAQPVGGPPGAGPGAGAQPTASQATPAPAAPSPQNTINGQNPSGPAYGGLHNAIVDMHKASVNAAARGAGQ